MAKWGEGDPRWIVEERPDATNVNNWHWVEKNATAWSKDKLKELLEGMIIEDDSIICTITEITKLDGEATANNRKAKLIFFYEWIITAKWKGQLKASSEKINGTLDIPNLSEENDADEVDVDVTTSQSGDEAYVVKEYLRVTGVPKIRDRLALYIQSLKEEYGQGAILPTKTGGVKAQVTRKNADEKGSSMKNAFDKMAVNSGSSSKTASASGTPDKIRTKMFCSTEEFKCRSTDIYKALTHQEMVQAYSGHGSIVDTRSNGHFWLFDGNVTGYFVELIEDKKIHAKWRYTSWPVDHFSDVVITITESDDCTKLVLRQNGIPESEYDKTIGGWTQNYWGRIRSVFGFGSRIF